MHAFISQVMLCVNKQRTFIRSKMPVDDLVPYLNSFLVRQDLKLREMPVQTQQLLPCLSVDGKTKAATYRLRVVPTMHQWGTSVAHTKPARCHAKPCLYSAISCKPCHHTGMHACRFISTFPQKKKPASVSPPPTTRCTSSTGAHAPALPHLVCGLPACSCSCPP